MRVFGIYLILIISLFPILVTCYIHDNSLVEIYETTALQGFLLIEILCEITIPKTLMSILKLLNHPLGVATLMRVIDCKLMLGTMALLST